MNRRNLHVCLGYCDVYEPAYRQNAAPGKCLTPAGRTSSVSHLQAREDKRRRRRRAVFTGPSKRGRQQRKKEEDGLEILSQARSVTHHFTGPPFVCTHPAEKGQPTSLRRGEGLTATVPHRRERDEKETVVVVVGDKRGTETYPA